MLHLRSTLSHPAVQSFFGVGLLVSVSLLARRQSIRSIGTGSDKPKKSQVYTRTGDGGQSSLYNGERRTKRDPVFDALGHQDELNAVIGIAREYCVMASNDTLVNKLVEIQSRLFDVGAAIATPADASSADKLKYTEFSARFTLQLEDWIDALDASLPPLQHFIVPSGGLCSTHLNLARTVCRRTERAVVPLVEAGEVHAEVGKYLNRLSDFLFVASRVAAAHEGTKEVLWIKSS